MGTNSNFVYWEIERIKEAEFENPIFLHVEEGWIEGFQLFLVENWYGLCD